MKVPIFVPVRSLGVLRRLNVPKSADFSYSVFLGLLGLDGSVEYLDSNLELLFREEERIS